MTDQQAPQRVFKIGTIRIVADDTLRELSHEEVRQMLQTTYPQVAHATVRETTTEDTTLIEFVPKPGRKG